MAPKAKRVPPESLPRRRPSGGGFHPITIHVRVNRDGNYLLSHLPETGGPFRDFRDLQDAVRARYADIYLSWHRRRRPLLPPPPSTDDIFQFRYVVEERAPRRRPTVPSAATQRQSEAAGVSSLKESLNATTLEEKQSGSSTATSSSSSSRRPDQEDTVMASPPSVSSRIWARVRPEWGFIYYVRVDLGGSFHTYPHAGGPFQSSEEAERAMDRYLHERRDPTLLVNQGGVPSVEMAIEQALYWPDGRRKKRSKSLCIDQTGSKVRQLVQALVDNHNEDHNLLGDLAYELKDVVHYRQFCENRAWFYHLNFTMTKVAGDSNCGKDDTLFFAEVKCVRQEKQEEMLVSCFCMVRSTRNGLCYGCTNNGSVNMKHPNGADKYIGGHLDVGRGSSCGWHVEWSDSDDDVEAKKKELRRMFTGSDDPNVNTVLWMHPDDVLLEED
uniref:Uncharacterized protein n=1 Tax=Avena sativa TaxID=4498 RepID=A0ACD5WL53_AVESA